MKRLLVVLFAVLAVLAPQAAAEDIRLGDLTIRQPWARASAGPAKAGAAYLAIFNEGAAADRLIAAETPAARRAELHSHQMDQGVMKMRPVEAVEIAPGGSVELKPGGFHVMLMGLAAPLKQGESFSLVLTFERAGRIEVDVRVGSVGAAGPGEQ